MFERFAADARDAVTSAHEVARAHGDDRITSAHLLVALARPTGTIAGRALAAAGVDPAAVDAAWRRHATSDDVDGAALAAIGIDLESVRAQVEATFGTGALDSAARPAPRRLPFATDAKQVLEQALRLAVSRKDRRLDSGHLLLAAVRLEGSAAQRVAIDAGIDAEALAGHVDRARGTAHAA